MTITFHVHYGTTPYFNGGTKTIIIEWEENQLPQRHTQIKLLNFLKEKITPKESFDLKGETTNIFAYIEKTKGWRIDDIVLGQKDGKKTWTFLISEAQSPH